MTSTGFEARSGEKQLQQEKSPGGRTSVAKDGEVDEAAAYSPTDGNSLKPEYGMHRRLRSRHIQLIGIGGYVNTLDHLPLCGLLIM